jgi:hypothetical protein
MQITPGPTNVGVLCDCQHLFCFECGQEAHAPATCGMLVAWKAKAKDGSETTNWYGTSLYPFKVSTATHRALPSRSNHSRLLSHTKSCPKCGKPVEKNGGCNHITVLNPGPSPQPPPVHVRALTKPFFSFPSNSVRAVLTSAGMA